MQPLRYENGIPIFSSTQIDDYGFPENWGFIYYEIIENRDTTTFATDYKLEQSYYKRPIHRYNRKQRFKNVIGQLMGDRGKVPDNIVSIVGFYLQPGDRWNEVRRVLKSFQWRIYYNRIPYIIQQLTKMNSTNKIHIDQYTNVMEDFDHFCFLFEKHKSELGRKYFPNMRFIALKLIEKNGIQLNYPIPVTRTVRKQKELDSLWDWFINKLER
ncbi:hypothetical protein QT971_06285 [Microcoleus sp. herbarium19]|uniref:hypothetical protein n=1 Tax=Microcoleus sp. herbarium19 TaxID=3055440 RepID=UPI002FCF0A0A